MDQKRPKIAETIIDPSVTLREAVIGLHCEVLEHSSIEYTTLGDFSYLGPDCIVADAEIGKFCAIAARVRIGAPNHPMDRPSCIASPTARIITVRPPATKNFSPRAGTTGCASAMTYGSAMP